MTTATLTNPTSTVPSAATVRAIVRRVVSVERVLLGLCFFVFGLNGFLNFIPAPKDPGPEAAAAFGAALFKAGYFIPMLKGVEVIAGAMLLCKRFVPLALALLAPVLVNIFAFHYFLAGGVTLSIVLIAIELQLAWTYRDAFRPMLAAR